MNTENTLACIRTKPDTLGDIQGKIREVLKFHKLTETGDGVVEADLLCAVLTATIKVMQLPTRKEYQHGRNFFQGEGQETANSEVDGWNDCVAYIQTKIRDNLLINI